MRSTSVSRAFLELLSAEHPKVVNSFTGASEALLEAGDYEVDSEGERRRMLVVYTLRYRAYFEAGMIGMAACAALERCSVVRLSWTAERARSLLREASFFL